MTGEALAATHRHFLSEDDWEDHTSSATLVQNAVIPFEPRQATYSLHSLRSSQWIFPVRDILERLANLEHGWDGYEGKPTAFRCIRFSVDILDQIMEDKTPLPNIVPTSEGGLQLEWHSDTGDLEIEIEESLSVSVFFADEETGAEWEDQGLVQYPRVRDAMRRLFPG